jgi:hypothetical protein
MLTQDGAVFIKGMPLYDQDGDRIPPYEVERDEVVYNPYSPGPRGSQEPYEVYIPIRYMFSTSEAASRSVNA